MLSNSWVNRLLLLITLLLALWLRVHQLELFPAGLHFDEAANAILSSEIAFEGYRPIFISSYTGKETFFFYAAGGIMNRVGSSIFSLRLTSAFFGLLTLAATYRLGNTVFRDRRIALIAVIFLAVNFSHLLFSRLGFRAISQPLTQILTVLFFAEGIQRVKKNRSAHYLFTAAGLFLGLTAHTYLAARLFPVALAIPLLVFIICKWVSKHQAQALSKEIKNLVLSGVIALIVLAPLLYWFSLNPEAFWVRIGQVGSTNESISVVEGLRRAALMLFFNGDPYIRFNLPGRPLFFPLMIIPAATGVWRIILQNKLKDIDGLFFGRWAILIIPFIMLLPTALATSEIVPSNLRAIGIFPFIVFWPAVGLVWLVEKLFTLVTQSTEQSRLVGAFISLFILLLGLSAGNVYRDYFTIWGNRSDSFYETEGDLREVAAYLNQLDRDQSVFVSTRFVPHPALAFLANSYDQITLIPESRALVYPAEQSGFYIFPASSPENSLSLTIEGEREQFSKENGVETFSTFKPDPTFPEAQTAAFSNFGFAVKMTGYDLESGEVGKSLSLTTYHEVLGNPGFNMIPFIHLEDHLGNRWVQLEQPGYAPSNWQSGDRFMQRFELPLPAGMPPTNKYSLRVGWFDEATGQEVTRFNEDNQFAGSAFQIESVALLPSSKLLIPALAPSQEPDTEIRQGLILKGLNFPRRQFTQGEPLDFELHWLADTAPDNIKLLTQIVQDDLVIDLELVDPAGDSYPFSDWQTPSFVIDRHRMQLPADLPPGEWELQTFAQFEDQSVQTLFDPIIIQITALDLVLEPPQVDHSMEIIFDDQLILTGYSLDDVSGSLELVWQATASPAGDYVAFVQLLNKDQTCCTWQADRPLVSSAVRPTSRWIVGEYVIDRYQIENYEVGKPLIVGLYRPENGTRLTTSEQTDFVQLP